MPEAQQARTGEAQMRMLRSICYDGLLFIANRVVSRVPSHFIRLSFYRYVMKFSIGPSSSIFMDAWFDTKGKGSFVMGHHSVINRRCRLDNRGTIVIGNNVSISAEVCILTADHDLHSPACDGRERKVTIGDYAFIGTRALLLPGVTVGHGAAVGAGSVVTKDIPEFTIVAGCPAKPIGTRRARTFAYDAGYRRPFQ
jgi:acetyltransferase-like isoleucine patch superfamily enzyme